jgi:hypothetical protein
LPVTRIKKASRNPKVSKLNSTMRIDKNISCLVPKSKRKKNK